MFTRGKKSLYDIKIVQVFFMNLLFCSACFQLFKNKVHSQILRMQEKAHLCFFFQRVGVVLGWGGGGENERVRWGWVCNINVQKG